MDCQNAGKENQPDEKIENYSKKLSELKKERDEIVSDFIGFLRKKKIENIKKTLEK